MKAFSYFFHFFNSCLSVVFRGHCLAVRAPVKKLQMQQTVRQSIDSISQSAAIYVISLESELRILNHVSN